MSRGIPRRWSPAAARELVLGSIPSCVGTDTDTWFSETPPDARRCVRICAECPVRTSCLAGALARGEEAGIWGGMLLGPVWVSSWVQAGEKTVTIYGRNPAGEPLTWRQSRAAARTWAAEVARAEDLALKLVAQGRRRAFVARWVRRIGMSVQSPGSWWIGPWTDPDPERRIEQMRSLVPENVRDRPVDRWPWELRLLTEFPDTAIPKAGAAKFSFRHNLDQDPADDPDGDQGGDDHAADDHGPDDHDQSDGDHGPCGWRAA